MGVLRSLGCRDRPDTQVSLLPGQHRSFLRCLVSTSQVCARYQRGAGKDRWGGDETRPRAQRGREGRHVRSECVAEADLVGTVSRGLPNRVTSERMHRRDRRRAGGRRRQRGPLIQALRTSPGALVRAAGLHHTHRKASLPPRVHCRPVFQHLGQGCLTGLHAP